MEASDINLVGPESWEYDVLAVAEFGGVSLRHVAFDIFSKPSVLWSASGSRKSGSRGSSRVSSSCTRWRIPTTARFTRR